MNITLILCIVSFLIPVIGSIFGYYKLRKKHLIEIEEHKNIAKSLRSQIVDMVENQAEVNKVERKSKQIKKDIKNMSDDELGIAYSQQLPNNPKKRSRKS